MKRKLLPILAGTTFLLSSCSDYSYDFTQSQLAHEKAFREAFGDFDKENDFNLAQRGEVTVTPNGNREVSIYKKAANGYQLIARYDDVTSTRTLGFDIPKGETEILVVNGSATQVTSIGGNVTFERGGILGGGNTGRTRAIPTNPGEDEPGYWTSSKWLYKSNDAPLKVKLNNGEDYTYYRYSKSEATSFETTLPEANFNRDKAIDNFSLISTGEFIIYPTYWNAAIASRVGIYYYDNEGNIHKQPIFGNHIYNESIQYLDSNGDWVTPKSEDENYYKNGGKDDNYYSLTGPRRSGVLQYRSKGIIVNLPVGTKFGFYTPMFEDNPTNRKEENMYRTYRDFQGKEVPMNANVYIPNNINSKAYTKDGKRRAYASDFGFATEYHLDKGTSMPEERAYGKWWFKDKDGNVVEANMSQNREYLDAYSESHLNPPDAWDKDYTKTTWTNANADESGSPLKYNRHAVMFGMYYDDNGDMVIGAEDAYFCTTTDQTDYDLNDRVFKIYGSQPLVLNNQAQSWHLAFEDLGSTDDWDFNDVVLQIDYVSGQTKARIRPLAAGGTLHSQVYFNDTNDDSNKQSLGEIHEWLGAKPVADDVLYEQINTFTEDRGTPGVQKEVTITDHDNFSIANAMEQANASQNITGVYIVTKTNEGANVIANSGMGKAPAMLVLPTSYQSGDNKYYEWAWPTERSDIRKAYNTEGHRFSDWVADHNTATDWYKHPTTGVVDAKVAGKYANGATTAGKEYEKPVYGTTITFPRKENNLYVFDASLFGNATTVTITLALKGIEDNALKAYDGTNFTSDALGTWKRTSSGGTFTTVGDGHNPGTKNVNIEGLYQIELSADDVTAIKSAGHWAITAGAESEIIYIAYK